MDDILPDYPMLIGGYLLRGTDQLVISSPASGEPFARIAWATRQDAEAALLAAKAAQPTLASMPPERRATLMTSLREMVIEHRDALQEMICLEVGKTLEQSGEDVQSLIDSLTYYAGQTDSLGTDTLLDSGGTHRHELRAEPVGVVVAYLAWNFPLLNLGFKLGPAMAAGCPIILKPSPKSPVSAYMIGRLCLEAGLPAGAVNVLCGPDAEVSEYLAKSTIPALLTLIGSTGTARKIMSAGTTSIKRYSLELGGNAPVLLFADADLGVAAETVATLKFGNAGQICVAPNRILVEASAKQRFLDRVVAHARAVKLGSGRDPLATMGPPIDSASVTRIEGMVQDAVSKGANILIGGGPPPGPRAGSYFLPTIIDNVRPGMALYDQEVFGPVVSLTTVESEEEAIRLANDTDTGLVAYVFTSNAKRAERCAAQLQFGEVQVNGVKYAIDLPHGGIKQSGIGHDCSALALRDYVALKRVSTALEVADA